MIITALIFASNYSVKAAEKEQAQKKSQERQGWRAWASKKLSSTATSVTSAIVRSKDAVRTEKKAEKKYFGCVIASDLRDREVDCRCRNDGWIDSKVACIFPHEIDNTYEPAYLVIVQGQGEEGRGAVKIINEQLIDNLEKEIKNHTLSMGATWLQDLVKNNKQQGTREELKLILKNVCDNFNVALKKQFSGKGMVSMAGYVLWKNKAICCAIGQASFTVAAQDDKNNWGVKKVFHSQKKILLGQENTEAPFELESYDIAVNGGDRLAVTFPSGYEHQSLDEMAQVHTSYKVSLDEKLPEAFSHAERGKFSNIPHTLNRVATVNKAIKNSNNEQEKAELENLRQGLLQGKDLCSRRSELKKVIEKNTETQAVGMFYIQKNK